jgi:hypothetical protein
LDTDSLPPTVCRDQNGTVDLKSPATTVAPEAERDGRRSRRVTTVNGRDELTRRHYLRPLSFDRG